MNGTGRYAPSPSGELHLGNLRTAIIAWLCAHCTGREFILRIEDLDPDRSRAAAQRRQLADLLAIGVTFDQIAPAQSTRLAHYRTALDSLIAAGATYECYCTRREINDVLNAPHRLAGGEGRYPGTCADLTSAERARRRLAAGRAPTIRFRGNSKQRSFDDAIYGPVTAAVEDVVLRRFDGAIAYNLAVTVDDAAQHVDQVVRGADLLQITATQIAILQALGAPSPQYIHVPMVLTRSGDRLSKRDGAIGLRQFHEKGVTTVEAVRYLMRSLGPAVPPAAMNLAEVGRSFELSALPRTPVLFDPAALRSN
ncbi:MAG: tRNA glutamyl-Q(34) synthetase GluQRS [Antricoccus sp.]